MKKTFKFEVGETINTGNYNNVKVVYGETIEVDASLTDKDQKGLRDEITTSVINGYNEKKLAFFKYIGIETK